MTNSKQKIIDDYLEKLKGIKNIDKVCVSTFDGFLMKNINLSEKELDDIPAVLSKYLNEISMFTKFSSGADFNVGFYLTTAGFMVITALKEEAIVQVVANGRDNIGQVLRLFQAFKKEYEA